MSFLLYCGVLLNVPKIDSILFQFTNVVLVLICITFLCFNSNESYSLKNIFYLFSFFFFGCSPIVEVSLGVTYWGGRELEISDYVIANVLIIFFISIYGGSYLLFSKADYRYDAFLKFDKKFVTAVNQRTLIYWLITTLIVIFVCFSIWSFNNFNVISILVRGGEQVQNERSNLGQVEWLIYMYFIRPMLVFVLLLNVNLSSKSKALFMVLLVLVLFHTSPVSMARFYFVTLYLPIFIYYTNLFRFNFSLSIYFIFGLLFIFPFLDKFRYFDSSNEFNWNIDFAFLTVGHFDSYQNFTRALEINFFSWGEQFLGSIFFFLPRSLWEGKPTGSGSTLAQLESLSFSNISMPLIAESFINLHLFGIVLVPIILGYITSYLDRFYWREGGEKGVTKLFYLFSLGLFLFMLRGDLLSSFAYAAALFLSLAFVVSLYYFACSFRIILKR